MAASLWVPPPSPSPSLSRRPTRFSTSVRRAVGQLSAGEPSPSSTSSTATPEFLRFVKGKDGGELKTSVVRYRKKFPWSLLQPFLKVDLVSTVHLADKQYFDNLKTLLEPYDCVLFEMVASRVILEDRKIKISAKDRASSSGFDIIKLIQRQMAQILSLDFQLDCLDYESEKWYHADLDIETFESLQREKGENIFTFALDATSRSTEALGQLFDTEDEDLDPWRSKLRWVSSVLPMPLLGLLIIESVCVPPRDRVTKNPELEALSRLDFGAALKLFLAKALTSQFAGFATKDADDSVIVGERNKVVIEALREAIEKGKNRVAVLYGGGHMPDLDRRLREEFKMVPSEVQWLTAWSIRSSVPESDSFPFLKVLAQLSGWPLNRYQTLALLIFSSVLAVDLCLWELLVGAAANWASWSTAEIMEHVSQLHVL